MTPLSLFQFSFGFLFSFLGYNISIEKTMMIIVFLKKEGKDNFLGKKER
jgi:hypothetical protein